LMLSVFMTTALRFGYLALDTAAAGAGVAGALKMAALPAILAGGLAAPKNIRRTIKPTKKINAMEPRISPKRKLFFFCSSVSMVVLTALFKLF
jgi:hypothetical protein